MKVLVWGINQCQNEQVNNHQGADEIEMILGWLFELCLIHKINPNIFTPFLPLIRNIITFQNP